MLSALGMVGDVLSRTDFPLETPGRDEAEAISLRASRQIEDYLLPRARSLESPLTIVVGGSTGAGKSTLVNTLLGQNVTTAGVVRPTTRNPVLVHHPQDAASTEAEHLLPHLPRSAPDREGSAVTEAPHLERVCTCAVPAGVMLIDAPDIDSVSDQNRRLSRQLLDAADLWLFITTANRYADAVPWQLLARAAQRNIGLVVVLNRTPAEHAAEIAADLHRLLEAEGLRPERLLTVTEQPRDEQGRLPQTAVSELRIWLDRLGEDAAARADLAARSLSGAVRAVVQELTPVLDCLEDQDEHRAGLAEILQRAQNEAEQRILDALSDGQLLRGEVMARWQDFVGTGLWFRKLETGIGHLRDRLANHLRGSPRSAQRLEAELETGLYRVIVEEAAHIGERVQSAWHRDRAGRHLLAEEDLGELPEDFPWMVQEQIRQWQEGIITMMSRQGAQKRQRARFLSAGLNVGSVLLMTVVFSMTGGLTGLEVGIAGGAGALGWKLLEAVFGEEAVRRMARDAREDLLERVRELMDIALEPFALRLPESREGLRSELFAARDHLDAAARREAVRSCAAPSASRGSSSRGGSAAEGEGTTSSLSGGEETPGAEPSSEDVRPARILPWQHRPPRHSERTTGSEGGPQT